MIWFLSSYKQNSYDTVWKNICKILISVYMNKLIYTIPVFCIS